MKRTLFILVLCVSSIVLLTAQRLPGQDVADTPTMVAAAESFLAMLDADQRTRAQFSFDDEERYNWHFIPRERNGLNLKSMTEAQQAAAHRLMKSALSEFGYQKANGVIELEKVLAVLEDNPEYRDAGNYYFSIFGEPSGTEPWGWRVEGHHLSLNFSSVTNELTSGSPAFYGANPARVPSGPHEGERLLAEEEDQARTLMGMLSGDRLDKARIATEAPRDIITGHDRKVQLETFEGLSAADMTDAQKHQLMDLMEVYLGKMQPDRAAAQHQKIDEAGFDKIYFAWAGSLERGQGHYYRIHGPTFLIEYDNTQTNANHIHSVYRDLEGDFAEDLLRLHYEHSDHH